MFKYTFILLLLIVSSVAKAETNSDIADFLNSVVESFNDQNCAKYSSHFIETNRQKKRRDSGLYFASNDSNMSLKESHVLSEAELSAEVALAYSVKDSDYVSRVFLEKENGEWKISKEIIVKNESPYDETNDRIQISQTSSNSTSSNSYTSNPFSNRSSPPKQNCPGGRCGGPAAPFSTLKACRDYGFDPIPCRNGSCSTR